jgi:DNA-binding NarL/FixJ family response regulator
MAIRVLIADDDVLVRSGLRMLLETQPDLVVVGEAGDGQHAVQLAGSTRPDVVLMDIRMPGLDGIQATRQIVTEDRDGPTRVVVLTTFELDEYVFESLRAGASGFLLKRTPPEELIAGIRHVAAGDALLAPSVTRRLIDQFASMGHRPASPTGRAIDVLTDREQQVLGLIARAMSNAEIASELYVSEGTVKTHVKRILMKLHLRDRVHAVVYAYETGVVRPRR